MPEKKYRFVLRASFDGVVCATLLQELKMVIITLFAEPADMKAACVEYSSSDTAPNLSYN